MTEPRAIPIMALAIAAPLTLAGELAPPPGAVAPTMKDLDDVEPRTAIRNDFDGLNPIVIASSGSYYLAENIDAFFDNHGIEILASDVTLDLNGFRVQGNTEVGSFDGIHVDANASNTVIKNGTVQFFFQDGIDAQQDLTLINVRVVGNFLAGVNAGQRANIHGCTAVGNGNRGFLLGSHAVVTDSIATGNSLNGFSISGSATVRGCVSEGNTGDGFFVSFSSVVENCVARENMGHGFDANGYSTFANCTAVLNEQNGFDPNSESVLVRCSAVFNTSNGFSIGSDNIVRQCTSVNNIDGEGIRVAGSGNLVEHNVCRGHTAFEATGILVVGDGNRIDSNLATDNFGGIIATGTDNFIIRNTAFNNSAGEIQAAGGNLEGGLSTDPSTAGPWDNFTDP